MIWQSVYDILVTVTLCLDSRLLRSWPVSIFPSMLVKYSTQLIGVNTRFAWTCPSGQRELGRGIKQPSLHLSTEHVLRPSAAPWPDRLPRRWLDLILFYMTFPLGTLPSLRSLLPLKSQKLKDFVRSLSLRSALTSDWFMTALSQFLHPWVKTFSKLVILLLWLLHINMKWE